MKKIGVVVFPGQMVKLKLHFPEFWVLYRVRVGMRIRISMRFGRGKWSISH